MSDDIDCAGEIAKHWYASAVRQFRELGITLEPAAHQIVGRERRERLSQLTWCGGGCFDSRRRVNSTVIRLVTRNKDLLLVSNLP